MYFRVVVGRSEYVFQETDKLMIFGAFSRIKDWFVKQNQKVIMEQKPKKASF